MGYYPSTYHFDVKPYGDIWNGTTLLITMPKEVSIWSKFTFERSCASNLVDFTYKPVSCKTIGNQIWVNMGFTISNTMNTTSTLPGQILQTPILRFDLTGFLNPRSLQQTSPWNITILDSVNKPYYYWQYPYGPNITMSGAASPRSISYVRNSTQNGAITSYNFTIVTMNYL